jgi:hypothetical protein
MTSALIVMLIPIIFWIARGRLLLHWWPIGIRLRQDGVAIGGVRWAEQHPGKRRRKASVLDRGCQVFFCRGTASSGYGRGQILSG